jgi:hypothetical protein
VVELKERLVDKVAVAGFLRVVHAHNLQVERVVTTRSNTVQ